MTPIVGGSPEQGVDALGHPAPAALTAAGKSFVCCYLKNITRAQIDAYLAAGIKVVLISETTGRRSLGGYSAGQADAHVAAQQMAALKAPSNVVIYFAEDDLDVSSIELPAVISYSRGLFSVLGELAGWYGGLRTVEALLADGRIKKFWQTYAWSHGTWAAGVALEQYLNGQSLGGTGVDLDRALAADFGAWLPPNSAPVLEDDMSAADVDAINAHTDQVIARIFASLSHGTTPDGASRNGTGLDQLLAAVQAVTVDPALVSKAVADALAAHPVTASIDPQPIVASVLNGLAARLSA